MRALLPVCLVLVACSSAASGGPTSESTSPTDPGTSTAPPGSPGTPPASSNPDAGPAAPDCSLAALAPSAAVAPTFSFATPPAMTGGSLHGSYVVDKATVYLPSAAYGIVDLNESKGSIAAWAVFAGSRYRLHLASDFTIATTSFGTQAQSLASDSQGGFTATGAALKLDHACDTAPSDEADYSFTDTGTGRAVILVKTPTPYGDVYLALEAKTS